MLRQRLSRANLLPFFARLPRCLVGMETCASANYSARELIALGHEIRLMPQQYVNPYVKRTLAIADEAAEPPPSARWGVALANKTGSVDWL
jgi:transposase